MKFIYLDSSAEMADGRSFYFMVPVLCYLCLIAVFFVRVKHGYLGRDISQITRRYQSSVWL